MLRGMRLAMGCRAIEEYKTYGGMPRGWNHGWGKEGMRVVWGRTRMGKQRAKGIKGAGRA